MCRLWEAWEGRWICGRGGGSGGGEALGAVCREGAVVGGWVGGGEVVNSRVG